MVWFGNSVYFPICLAAWGSYQVRILPATAGEGTVLKKSLLNQCILTDRVMLSLYASSCEVFYLSLLIFLHSVILCVNLTYIAMLPVLWYFKPSEMSCLVRHVLYTCSTGRWGYRVMIIMRILHCLLYAATAHVVWSPWPERIYSLHPACWVAFMYSPMRILYRSMKSRPHSIMNDPEKDL